MKWKQRIPFLQDRLQKLPSCSSILLELDLIIIWMNKSTTSLHYWSKFLSDKIICNCSNFKYLTLPATLSSCLNYTKLNYCILWAVTILSPETWGTCKNRKITYLLFLHPHLHSCLQIKGLTSQTYSFCICNNLRKYQCLQILAWKRAKIDNSVKLYAAYGT